MYIYIHTQYTYTMLYIGIYNAIQCNVQCYSGGESVAVVKI